VLANASLSSAGVARIDHQLGTAAQCLVIHSIVIGRDHYGVVIVKGFCPRYTQRAGKARMLSGLRYRRDIQIEKGDLRAAGQTLQNISKMNICIIGALARSRFVEINSATGVGAGGAQCSFGILKRCSDSRRLG
jgi:hypothetical protein